MKIRRFQSTDTDSVIALWEACGLTRPWNNPALDIARKCAVDDGLFLVGQIECSTGNKIERETDSLTGNGFNSVPHERMASETDGEIVATVMGSYDGHRGWIYYLAVHPAQQRQGLGEQLMHDVEARLLALGCPKINLQIRRENVAVMAFYEAMGFSEDASVSLGKRLISDN